MKVQPREGWKPIDFQGNGREIDGLAKDIFLIFESYDGWKLTTHESAEDGDNVTLHFDAQDDACEVAELILSKWAK